MEFKKYLIILKNYFGFILIFTIIAGLTAYLGSIYKPVIYEGETTLLISPVPKSSIENPDYYEFDGFYAIQSSQLFANTVSGWLSSPDIVKSIYQEANLDLETKNIEELRERIKTSVKSTQSQNNLVDAVFKAKSNLELKKISDATYNVLSQRVEQFNKSTGNKITYRIDKLGEPIVVKIIPNVTLNTILGVIAGIILSIILAFLAHYFKKEY
ncbi:MAG: hypothetical protein ABH837_03915 [bacterium]